MKNIVLALSALLISGCVNDSALFLSPNGKEIYRCANSGFGVMGSIVSKMSFHRCKEDAIKMGYRPLEEKTEIQESRSLPQP